MKKFLIFILFIFGSSLLFSQEQNIFNKPFSASLFLETNYPIAGLRAISDQATGVGLLLDYTFPFAPKIGASFELEYNSLSLIDNQIDVWRSIIVASGIYNKIYVSEILLQPMLFVGVNISKIKSEILGIDSNFVDPFCEVALDIRLPLSGKGVHADYMPIYKINIEQKSLLQSIGLKMAIGF